MFQFAFTARGTFNPLCAFFGGFVAQEVIKAITGKFTPCKQVFYYDASEVLPEFEVKKDMLENEAALKDMIKNHKTANDKSRNDGLRICIGQDLLDKLAKTKLFMVGAGAIGCELLKNYAMCGVGTQGKIVMTDPDVIEVSNLNRQFLFRAKHVQKAKSQTAGAAAIDMNPDLKDRITARLDKVHDGTAHIFTD